MKTKKWAEIEKLSAKFHDIYQQEAKRQSDLGLLGLDEVRHPDKYEDLPECTKEYDRVLARYVQELLDSQRAEPLERLPIRRDGAEFEKLSKKELSVFKKIWGKNSRDIEFERIGYNQCLYEVRDLLSRGTLEQLNKLIRKEEE